MTYKERLKKFNSTVKYEKELEFLFMLINPDINDSILDYGCGTGYAMKYIFQKSSSSIEGYDITSYLYGWDSKNFKSELDEKYDTIYFLPSIAHIEGNTKE